MSKFKNKMIIFNNQNVKIQKKSNYLKMKF